MGCGSCPKKQLKLNSQPQGISRDLLVEMQSYVEHTVAVRDRIGLTTVGKCLEIWVDDQEQGELIETGNIAIETPKGLSMIGLNIVESIELLDPAASVSTPLNPQ